MKNLLKITGIVVLHNFVIKLLLNFISNNYVFSIKSTIFQLWNDKFTVTLPIVRCQIVCEFIVAVLC
jgi:hypothetical protein